MEVVEIKPSVLRQQVEDGMKLKPLAEHYNLPVTQMKKVLQQLDLTIRKFQHPKFIILDEEVEEGALDVSLEGSDELTVELAVEEVETVETGW